ncbi:DNA-binding CsgD family transcriptional regulator [Pseudorhizobium tarimense]|uniref:DNA-binding CsgD family transcriptional regulator n=1 Tax=Pseudorhizobium tarimense TaxID=1079109 RepID=A0ABV2HA40_9HYPH|nr:LuxR C-terminal-related transcriptional regulator [Pseudorhizobium tarimense]MCJ8520578.1 LuxR C-terminal-related transcriptional regulator [Pseudorhizobium tarimense]
MPYPGAVAAVFLGAANDEAQRSDSLASAFGLTDAESRMLRELLAGKTRAEAAQSQRVALTTAKTHLGNIFVKTGTRGAVGVDAPCNAGAGVRSTEAETAREAEA